jgi:two-component system cell cycle sensor histidine kinase/response regulator CckA
MMTSVASILVVEDNPTTRKMLRVALATEGYGVVEAANARAALAAAEKTLPDLVLQDLILPDMDGLELLRCLRALPGGAELPILALSGFLSRLEEAQTDGDGFTALLVKPIEPSRLIEAIRMYLPREPELAMRLGEGRRLLVVDDDLIQLKLTRLHFSQLGFDVSAAGGASDALITARVNPPDAILSDVFMPDTDGFELCLEIRRDPNLATVPVVLVSGEYGSKADRDLARRVGANALVFRTPDFRNVALAIMGALHTRAPMPAEQPSDQLELRHARLVIHQLQRRAAAMAGLAQRCGIQAAELSLLSGVADALSRNADPNVALRDVLAATLDAAGISKGALILRDAAGVLGLRQAIGFSEAERSMLQNFFGQSQLLEDIVDRRASVTVPSSAIPDRASQNILAGAHIAAAHIVPLISDGRGVGAMIIGATSKDVTTDDSVAFARAMGNQVVQSLELTKSVARLTASDQRYRTLLENATDFIAVLTADGIVREMNHRWVTFTGLPQEQLIGRHVRDFAAPGKADENVRTHNEAVATSALRTPPVEIAGVNGSRALIEFSSTTVDVGGERLVFTIGRDVTERQQAHAALRQERDRAQRYLDTAEVILLALDVDGRITQVNRYGCAVLGWAADELVGRDWVETCLPARVRDAFRKTFRNVIGGDLSIVEHPIQSRSGEERLIEWRNTVLRDDAGNITGTFSSGTDITERNQAAEALRTAEERMRFALQNADVGIWDMDYTTGVLRWSPTLEAHYGLQPGTFGGTFASFVECIHPADRASVLETVGKAVNAGSDFSILNRSIRPDGTVRWLSGAGRILLGERGEPVRGVGISLDVTERRTLEEQFQQAQKMEAVGRLAGGVAHDFNNLLTVILGYCELLLADFNPDDPRQADISQIQKAGTRAGGLTRQLLAFSRKQIIEPTWLDLNLVVADLRAMLGRLIGEDVKVVLRLQPVPSPVTADRGQVEQIVMNLAVNARDAMPTGGTLMIETASVELDEHYAKTHLSVKPGPYVALRVTDTGTGMTPQVQARLFEPFFTTKDVGKGTGLGLATVHGIVARSGGSVNVYSEVGRGTSFHVYFPRTDVAETVVEVLPPVARPHAGTQTVLVVEDEQELRELAKKLLGRLGYRVLVAANAEEGRQLFDQNASIDVLLTDVVMPGASGPELTGELVKRRPRLKVIYMSGYTEDAIVQHGVLKPGIAFLNKPFTSDTLGRKIREVLDREDSGLHTPTLDASLP